MSKNGEKQTAKEQLGKMRGFISFEEGHSFEDMSEKTAQSLLNTIDKARAEHTAKKSSTKAKP
ncbi:MAG: hypothetical protein Q7S16_03990 [bacterium]|nr:hypothetical protein [bacterium]